MKQHLAVFLPAFVGAFLAVFAAGLILIGVVDAKIDSKLRSVERLADILETAATGVGAGAEKAEDAVSRTIERIRRLGKDSSQ